MQPGCSADFAQLLSSLLLVCVTLCGTLLHAARACTATRLQNCAALRCAALHRTATHLQNWLVRRLSSRKALATGGCGLSVRNCSARVMPVLAAPQIM